MRYALALLGRLRWACVAFVLLCAAPAWAQNCTASLTDIDFGSPALPISSHVDTTGTISIRCSGIGSGTQIKMCPGFGYGTGGSAGGVRTLLGPGGATVTFGLYQDAARLVPWGSVATPELGSVPLVPLQPASPGTETATVRVYARLLSASGSAPGVYTSSFAGSDASFYWSRIPTGEPGDCDGFTSTHVIHPEFTVRATLTAACTVTAGDLVFPASGLLTTALVSQTNLWVTCAASTVYTVGLDYGLHGASPARRMQSGSGALVAYELFRDAGRVQPWGTEEEGLAAAGTGTGTPQNFIAYGRVPVQETPAPGQFVDRVIVTVTY